MPLVQVLCFFWTNKVKIFSYFSVLSRDFSQQFIYLDDSSCYKLWRFRYLFIKRRRRVFREPATGVVQVNLGTYLNFRISIDVEFYPAVVVFRGWSIININDVINNATVLAKKPFLCLQPYKAAIRDS